jgi:hypothetical protein
MSFSQLVARRIGKATAESGPARTGIEGVSFDFLFAISSLAAATVNSENHRMPTL